jgi:DNA-binding NtrC family response regulator
MSGASQYKAFIVDDEHVIGTTLKMILARQGFDARSFVEPLDALREAQQVSPDLLLTDVVMPTMNGIELAIHIKQLCPDCKVLLLSGQSATVDLLARARVDGHHFELLGKPVHPTKLVEKIWQVLDCTNAS